MKLFLRQGRMIPENQLRSALILMVVKFWIFARTNLIFIFLAGFNITTLLVLVAELIKVYILDKVVRFLTRSEVLNCHRQSWTMPMNSCLKQFRTSEWMRNQKNIVSNSILFYFQQRHHDKSNHKLFLSWILIFNQLVKLEFLCDIF